MTNTNLPALWTNNRLPARRQVLDPVIDDVDLPGRESAWRAVARPADRGILLIVLFIATFWLWAYYAPLDGGAVASGVVSPDGNKRTVQHLEGGIIAKLNVRDGDMVRAGQPLLILEDIQPRSMVDALRQESRTLIATRARLEAEKAGSMELVFPPALISQVSGETKRIFDDQFHLFHTRLQMHQARKQVLRQRVSQLMEQIQGFKAQVKSADRQLVLIAEEVQGKAHLLKQNLIAKPEVLKLERAEAEIIGRKGEFVAHIARAGQQIGETELQLMTLEAERSDQVANQLDEVRRRLGEVDQRLDANNDVLKRTVIAAPADGIVHNMKFKTEGGVVIKGEPILDIVPANDALLIDARLSPNDIDIVRPGMPAVVHLTAYSSRSAVRIKGAVKQISADRMIDETSKQPYFLARVEVARGEIERLTPKIEMLPGMPAEVIIVTERRTLIQYLLRPFFDAWRRSFLEA